VQTSGETQDFFPAVEQMARRALVELPVAFVQTGAAHPFIDGLRDWEVKQHLLMGGDRTLNEALNQALKLEAATGPPARLRELTRATARAYQPSDRWGEGRPVCWQCESAVHLRRDRRQRPREERNQESGKRINAGEEKGHRYYHPLTLVSHLTF
jgi:hypothetical protein